MISTPFDFIIFIKRSLIDDEGWALYIAGCLQYSKANFENSYYKNNGTLETRLYSETESVIENAPILYSKMPEPLIEPILIKETIAGEFNDVVSYLDSYEISRGYVRLYDSEGNVKFVFIKTLNDLIRTGKTEIIGLKKYETEYLRIDTTDEGILVNDAPNNLQGAAYWYKTENDQIKLFDKKSRPLSNFYNFEFVILNGQKFESIDDLNTALSIYQWT